MSGEVPSPSSSAWSDTFKDLKLSDTPSVDPMLQLSDQETPSSQQQQQGASILGPELILSSAVCPF